MCMKSMSTKFEKRKLDTASGEISPDYLDNLYGNDNKYRVSKHIYTTGEVVNGSCHEGKCYVIEGSCKFQFSDGSELIVEAGDMFNFPSGSYEISTSESTGVKYALVWDVAKIARKID